MFQFPSPLSTASSPLSSLLLLTNAFVSLLSHLFLQVWIITSIVCFYESSFPWARSDLYIHLVIYETPTSNQALCETNKEIVS